MMRYMGINHYLASMYCSRREASEKENEPIQAASGTKVMAPSFISRLFLPVASEAKGEPG